MDAPASDSFSMRDEVADVNEGPGSDLSFIGNIVACCVSN